MVDRDAVSEGYLDYWQLIVLAIHEVDKNRQWRERWWAVDEAVDSGLKLTTTPNWANQKVQNGFVNTESERDTHFHQNGPPQTFVKSEMHMIFVQCFTPITRAGR